MLSYVTHDSDRISEIYEDLSDEDLELITDSIEEGEGLRLFQDGSLQDEKTSELILEGHDEDLMDDEGFTSEAEEAGAELESDEEDVDSMTVVIDDLELDCVVAGEVDDDEEGDTLDIVVHGLPLSCVLAESTSHK